MLKMLLSDTQISNTLPVHLSRKLMVQLSPWNEVHMCESRAIVGSLSLCNGWRSFMPCYFSITIELGLKLFSNEKFSCRMFITLLIGSGISLNFLLPYPFIYLYGCPNCDRILLPVAANKSQVCRYSTTNVLSPAGRKSSWSCSMWLVRFTSNVGILLMTLSLDGPTVNIWVCAIYLSLLICDVFNILIKHL